jgi:WD40 repeat protein
MYRAVKFVSRQSFRDQRPWERELSGIRKFEPISRSHEGFVDVLHVGINEEQGYFYYVMELGDDRTSGQNIIPEQYVPKTLSKEIKARGRLPLQDCLQLGLALSQAIGELHRHALVHRDIKPSNIIYVNGVPKLADIGLVAEANEARSYVGTEGFIPPEGPGTACADVYGLGKVLYEAATGLDRQQFPELPTVFDTVPEHEKFLELNEVILRACNNLPSKRYESGWEMHAALVVLANGKSVRRLHLLERRLSKLKRIGAISALATVALGGIGYQVYRERRDAIENLQRQVGASVAYGTRAEESGDPLGALPYFADALRLDVGNPAREITHRLRFGSVLAQSPKLTRLWFEGKELAGAQFSPDGKSVLICQYEDKAVVRDLETGRRQEIPSGDEALLAASYSADGRWVVTAGEQGKKGEEVRKGIATLWDALTLREVRKFPSPKVLLNARFAPASWEGLHIITSCVDGYARLWDAQTGTLEQTFGPHSDEVHFAGFSHNGKLVVTASHDGTARLWQADTGEALRPVFQHDSWVIHAAFSPDDKILVTAGADRVARVWDVETGAKLTPDLNHDDLVYSVQFSPSGGLFLTASLDGLVHLWRTDTKQALEGLSVIRHVERVVSASFGRDDRQILTSCADGSVRVWDLAGCAVAPGPTHASFSTDGSRSFSITGTKVEISDAVGGRNSGPSLAPEPTVEKACFSENGAYLATLSRVGNAQQPMWHLQVWDTGNAARIGPVLSFSGSPTNFCLSDNGRLLATLTAQVLESWDVPTGSRLGAPRRLSSPYEPLGWNRKRDHLAAASTNEVCIWDARGQQLSEKPLTHPQAVTHLEFSPDGRYLVTCCSDPKFTKCFAQVWDVGNGYRVGPSLNHGDGVLWASFSPDSRQVVTCGEDFIAIVWDVATGTALTPPLRHRSQVRAAAFSHDGKWVVTASWDKTARVWDARTGEPLTPALRHLQLLANAEFLADDRSVVTTDVAGDTRKWELRVDARPVDDLLALAQLLSGGPSPSAKAPRPSEESLWERLRSKCPSDFTTPVQAIAAWHQFEARVSELHKQWPVAIFHLNYLLSLSPQDQSLMKRLDEARRSLASEQ